jgi:hypothetical protein
MTNHAHAAKSIIVVHYILHFFFNARALEDLAGQKNFILKFNSQSMNRGEIEFFIHCLFVSFKLIIIISKGLLRGCSCRCTSNTERNDSRD